jgi:hypothetical protein
MTPQPTGSTDLVGFSGLPITGGCGLRRPVYHDHESGDYFWKLPNDTGRRRDSEEFEFLVEQGLATKVKPQRVVPSWDRFALYAHPDFIKPGGPGTRLPPKPLKRDGRSRLFLAYLPCNEAVAIQEDWCKVLVNSSRNALEGWRVHEDDEILNAVETDLQRARFCTAEVVDGELRGRVVVWQLILARVRADRQAEERILDDVALDFVLEKVESIYKEAEMKQLQLLQRKAKRRLDSSKRRMDLDVFSNRQIAPRTT